MNTQLLIERLSTDVPPVSRHALAQRVGLGIVAGCVGTLVLVIAVLGIRPDLPVAIHGLSLWMKLGYSMALGVGAAYAVTRLARPTPGSLRSSWLLSVPVLTLTGFAGSELLRTPSDQWLTKWLGQSWIICPWLVLMLAAPLFVGLMWSFRKFAPTRLRAAGAAAGLTAGAWAAALYGLHCPDDAAIFVFTWYSLGMLLASGVGALLGPRMLRW